MAVNPYAYQGYSTPAEYMIEHELDELVVVFWLDQCPFPMFSRCERVTKRRGKKPEEVKFRYSDKSKHPYQWPPVRYWIPFDRVKEVFNQDNRRE
jgi:hypothetical protein